MSRWGRLGRPAADESYEEMRQRMIEETSDWITECLRHPELATRIPIIPAESGRFPRSFATSFWEPLLSD